MIYREPVPLAFINDRVVSPAVIVSPHAIALPPFASCTCVEFSRATDLPIMLPDVIDFEQPTLLGYASTPTASSASSMKRWSHDLEPMFIPFLYRV